MFEELAKHYQSEFGFNLVPLGGDKRPVLTGGISKSGKPYRFVWEDWQATPQPANFWDKCSQFSWWKDVQGLAVVCGIAGLVCVDFDQASFDAVETFLESLAIETEWIVQSPGGGYHVYVRCLDLDLPKGKIDRPGVGAAHIEIRHVGHYVALPGSAHPSGGTYLWRGQMPSELPPVVSADALMTAYSAVTVEPLPKVERPYTNGHSAPPVAAGDEVSLAYVRRAFDDELAKLAATRQGGRNHALNTAAFALGQLVADGVLDEYEVISALEQTARSIGLDDDEIAPTIASGLDGGKRQPRGLRLRAEGSGAAPQHVVFDWDAVGGDWAEIADADVFDLFKYSAEEGGVLDVWMDYYGDQWLYVPDDGRWYQWAETHWASTKAEALGVQLQTLLSDLNKLALEALAEARRAEDKADMQTALAWLNATRRTKARIFSIRYMAQEQRSESVNALNAGNALNCANGVLNLDDYTLAEHAPSQRFTYCLPYAYDPDADCPRWRQFCAEVFVDAAGHADGDLIRMVQQAVGYSLTADTHHEAMFWLSGEGSNGKTVFLSVLRSLLGHMAIAIDFQQLGQPGNYDLASLPGKRVVVSTEAERGGGLAEGYIKRIVSGEIINARAIRGEPFEFKSNAKLWWAMNDKPTVKDTSNAIWRRLKLIEFRRIFTEEQKDTRLLDKLIGELPGILNWAIHGLQTLRQAGRFQEPESMRRAREEYRVESNPVLQWLQENTIQMTGYEDRMSKADWTKSKDAYEDYRDWCNANGRQPYNATNFGRELARLGIEKARMPGVGAICYSLRLVADGGLPSRSEEEILQANGL